MKSKLFFIILSLYLFTSYISLGQSYVGVFAGINSSKLAGDTPTNAKYKSLTGVNTGAYFDLKLTESVMLSLQPSYSQEGAKVSYTIKDLEDPVDSFTVKLNYFSLPLFLKVASTNKRFYALGGLETGILMNSSITSIDNTEDRNIDIAEINIAMHFGAGYRIPIGYPRLFIELRYAQGLVNLTDEPTANMKNVIPRIKTTGFKVLAGIEIPLTKSTK